MKRFVLFVMLMMSVAVASEVVLLIIMNRDSLGMPVGKSELEWSMLSNRTVFH